VSAPPLQNVAKPDEETAKDLRERYDIAASHAATAWKNAEVICEGLIAKGMALNAQTAASVDHLKLSSTKPPARCASTCGTTRSAASKPSKPRPKK
jgi:hypothetical protein